MSNQHIALLGDSIFDNAAYTDGAPDVVAHLRAILPTGGRASLLAVDGSTTHDLAPQVEKVPADATHLVLSLGGNDALMNSDVLNLPVSSTAEALRIFGERGSAFILRAALERRLGVIDLRLVCAEPSDYANEIEPSGAGGSKIAKAILAASGT